MIRVILEFLEVGKKVSALEVLNDFIRSRKHKSKWTLAHEEIMYMFTDLCIDLQRSSYAKDGLYQYRTTCKDTALNSFEKVVKRFLSKAEEKAQAAKKESAEASQAALMAVEDLDYVATPEGWVESRVVFCTVSSVIFFLFFGTFGTVSFILPLWSTVQPKFFTGQEQPTYTLLHYRNFFAEWIFTHPVKNTIGSMLTLDKKFMG